MRALMLKYCWQSVGAEFFFSFKPVVDLIVVIMIFTTVKFNALPGKKPCPVVRCCLYFKTR